MSFGESHGRALGAVIDGCPAGVAFSMDLLKQELKRRRPGRFPWQTARKEPDSPEVLSGVFNNKTLGTPIAIIVKNKNFKPSDYDEIKHKPRRGHADDLWMKKFGLHDHRGGGRASGRETLARVMAGALARMFLEGALKNFKILAYTQRIGPYVIKKKDLNQSFLKKPSLLEKQAAYFPDMKKAQKIKELLISAKKKGESYGGEAVLIIQGAPIGLGQPVFRKLKSTLTSALMGIGSVHGVFIGQDEAFDGQSFHKKSKNYGGLRGGLSTGEDIEIHLKFKAPSSMGKTAIKGRHDPCVIPRAIPVLEAMGHLVMADHLLAKRLDQL